MGRISVLDDAVINKIAAGEVVERPASVVKELVENALDAGARRLEVLLEQGGIKRIVITDDGCGMDGDDAALALVRHATSKIRSADDLFQIGTMGFRGEALASIAAVSRFSLVTRERGVAEGTKLINEGGSLQRFGWGGVEGTTVAVEDLFFNVPVRAKFLKSAATEFAQCLEVMQAFVLAYPHVSFSVTHNGKEQLRAPAVTSEEGFDCDALRQRAAAVLGKDIAASLVHACSENRYGRFEALLSPPGIEKGSSRHMFSFVNRRAVKDRVVRYGILRGYHTHLLKGRFPVVVSHLSTDPALIDVNVHPAKTELRFQYPQEVQSLIAIAVREALRSGQWVAAPDSERSAPKGEGSASAPLAQASNRQGSNSNESHPSSSVARSGGSGFRTRVTTTSFPGASFLERDFAPRSAPVSLSSTSSLRGSSAPSVASTQAPLFAFGGDFCEPTRDHDSRSSSRSSLAQPSIPWDELEYLGAFDRCYLFFSCGKDLLVIDQHAFHERVLFERLARNDELLALSQPLLVPEAIELSPLEIAALAASREELGKRGFGFVVDSPACITVTSVPSILASRDLTSLFAALAQNPETSQDLDEAQAHEAPADANAGIASHVLATMACHAAVRAGEELGANELKMLLREARHTDFYHNCPHGRRVFRWWSRDQVASWFDR